MDETKIPDTVTEEPVPLPFTRWSPTEDALLAYAVQQEGGPPISFDICVHLLQHLHPELSRSPWTKEEDDLIVYYHNLGYNWSQIADKLPGRFSEHVRDRFTNFVDPSLKKAHWTEEERRILLEAQQRMGNKWTAIAKLLPGRSQSMVKNFWYNSQLTKKRQKSASGLTDRPNQELEDSEEPKKKKAGKPAMGGHSNSETRDSLSNKM